MTKHKEDYISNASGISIEVPTLEPLSLKGQNELMRKIRNGDEDAKIKLFGSLKGLIAKNLLMYYGIPRHQYDDAMIACYVGFEEACNRFSFEFGVKFSTYAFYWLRIEFLKWRRKQSFIHIPVDKLSLLRKLESHLSGLPGNGQWPWNLSSQDVESFCEQEGCDQKIIEETLHSYRISRSNNPFSEEGSQRNSMGTMLNPLSKNSRKTLVEREAFALIKNDVLEHAMNKVLTSRERKVFKLLFGLEGETPCTLAEVAPQIGLSTRQGVSIIRIKGLRKIKDFLEKNHPELCCAT